MANQSVTIQKHCFRLFRADAPNDQCILGECKMTQAEADHFNQLLMDQTAKWFKVD